MSRDTGACSCDEAPCQCTLVLAVLNTCAATTGTANAHMHKAFAAIGCTHRTHCVLPSRVRTRCATPAGHTIITHCAITRKGPKGCMGTNSALAETIPAQQSSQNRCSGLGPRLAHRFCKTGLSIIQWEWGDGGWAGANLGAASAEKRCLCTCNAERVSREQPRLRGPQPA